MKRTISLFLIMAVLIAVFCSCGLNEGKTDESDIQESLKIRLIHKIDDAYKEKLKLSEYNTTAGKIELSEIYAEKWKQVSDEYYSKLMVYDDVVQLEEYYPSVDDFHNYISFMKENWNEYSQDQSENYAKILEVVYGSGSMAGSVFAEYEYEMEKDWALQLIDVCGMLNIK